MYRYNYKLISKLVGPLTISSLIGFVDLSSYQHTYSATDLKKVYESNLEMMPDYFSKWKQILQFESQLPGGDYNLRSSIAWKIINIYTKLSMSFDSNHIWYREDPDDKSIVLTFNDLISRVICPIMSLPTILLWTLAARSIDNTTYIEQELEIDIVTLYELISPDLNKYQSLSEVSLMGLLSFLQFDSVRNKPNDSQLKLMGRINKEFCKSGAEDINNDTLYYDT